MKYRALSGTGLELSVIGIGTWAIGSSGWKYSWGKQDDDDSIAAIHAALDSGVNWIDTAAVYGIGHAEEVISKAIKSSKHKPIIATKCGLLQDKKGGLYPDISEKSIRKEIEGSLKRLDVDVIDIYQIHWPNPTRDIEEAFNTLLALVKEGKIRYPSVSNFSLDQLERISKIGLPASLQSPFSLIRPELSYEVIPWCIKHNVSILAYSPLQCGLLTGKASKEWILKLPSDDWRKDNKYFKEPLLSEILLKAEKLKTLAPVMPAAINWVISQPGITSAIIGMRNSKQVSDVMECLETKYSEDLIERIGGIFS